MLNSNIYKYDAYSEEYLLVVCFVIILPLRPDYAS